MRISAIAGLTFFVRLATTFPPSRFQHLGAIPDPELIELCRKEGRALVTLDLEFGNPLLYRPSKYAGIAVVRLSRDPSHRELMSAMRTLANALAANPLAGNLWIVQARRVRFYQPDN